MQKFLAILGILVLAIISFEVGIYRGHKTAPIPEPQSDTLYVTDTIFQDKPVPYIVYKEKPIPYPITKDSLIFQHDTLYLPKEVKVYKDSTYEAQVSGVMPNLDYIKVFPKTTVITNTVQVSVPEPPKRFGIGIQVGYGSMPVDGVVHLAPYIGLGLSYNLIRF